MGVVGERNRSTGRASQVSLVELAELPLVAEILGGRSPRGASAAQLDRLRKVVVHFGPILEGNQDGISTIGSRRHDRDTNGSWGGTATDFSQPSDGQSERNGCDRWTIHIKPT